MYQDAGSNMAPGAPAPEKKKGGCLKWGGIGCAVLLLLIIIAGVIGYTQCGKIVEWFGAKMKEALIEALPEDFPRAEAVETIDAFYDALKEDRLQASDMQELQTRIQAAQADGNFSEEEALELLEFMREKVGLEPLGAGEEEAPQEVEPGWETDEPAEAAGETAGGATEL